MSLRVLQQCVAPLRTGGRAAANTAERNGRDTVRIRLAVEGSRGDVQPMTALGRALADRGHDVAVCSSPDSRDFIEEAGLAFRPVGCDVRAFLTQNAEAITQGGLKMVRAAHGYFQKAIAEQFAALPEATSDAELVIGAGVQLAGASAAEHHGVSYRYCLYTPVLMPSAEYPAPVLPQQDLPIWVNRLSWKIFTGFYEYAMRGSINHQRAILGLAPLSTSVFDYLLTKRPIVATDEEWSPVPRDCRYEHDPIGYLHAIDETPLPAKLEGFLDAGPQPIYIGFGSMTDPEPAETTRTLLQAIEQLGCRALVSRGWAGLADGPLPQGVMALDSVNHSKLFPRMAAIVHHGGAGTTSTAARAGVPQLVVPHMADQFYFGNRVALMGLGPPPLPRPDLSASRLAERLGHMLDNEILTERAGDLGRTLRSRAPFDLEPILRASEELAASGR